MADAAPTELKTYHGNCHCGAVKFTVTLPPITSITECNCSICFRKGYTWLFPPAGALVFQEGKGEDKLKEYEFGKKTMAHKFCSTCGTAIMGKKYNTPAGQDIAINVRSLSDLGADIWTLKSNPYNGKGRQPEYVPHPYTGTEPEVVMENGKVYTGSCHCGGTTIAFKAQAPLPEGKEYIQQCNCSICTRNATFLTYPSRSQVTISTSPSAPLTAYRFGRRYQDHYFCSVCGVSICIRKLDDITHEKFAAHPMMAKFTPEETQEKFKVWKDKIPINLRVFDGVEWKDIEIAKGNFKEVGTPYEVPA